MRCSQANVNMRRTKAFADNFGSALKSMEQEPLLHVPNRRETRSRASLINAVLQGDEEDVEDPPLPTPPISHLWTYPVAGVTIPGLVFALLALGILTAAFMDWKFASNPTGTLFWGRPIYKWCFWVAIFIALFPLSSLVATYGIRLVLVMSGDEHLFYFISPLDLPLTYFLVSLGSKVSYFFFLGECIGLRCMQTQPPGAIDNFDLTYELNDIFDFVCNLCLVMSIVSGVLIIVEKVLLTKVHMDNSWEQVSKVMFHERMLQKMWSNYSEIDEEPRNIFDIFAGVQPTWNAFARLQAQVKKTPFLYLGKDSVINDEESALKAARILFTWADKDRKGYLSHSDFQRMMLDAAFMYFDKVRDHRVNKSEWEECFKALMSERANLSRTITDQENIAGILSRVFLIFFWFIGLFVSLMLLRVPISAFLPAATFILSFSFAFGNALKNIFESLLVVLVIRPFNVGDWIEVDDQVYKVARIFTLTTEAVRLDGRLFVLPNFALQSNKICNRTRSRPYTLVTSLELGNDVRSEQILDFNRALSRWLADDPLTWGEAVVHLDSMNPDGKLVLKAIIPMKNISWSKAHIWRSCQTTLLLFIRKLCQDLGLPVPKNVAAVEATSKSLAI